MASSKTQKKVMLEAERFEEVCETAAARDVAPGDIIRERIERLISEAESDPAAMRELMNKLGHKGRTVH